MVVVSVPAGILGRIGKGGQWGDGRRCRDAAFVPDQVQALAAVEGEAQYISAGSLMMMLPLYLNIASMVLVTFSLPSRQNFSCRSM